MKLADWLYTQGKTPAQLRRMLGIEQRMTVWRWLTGERTPNYHTMHQIIRLSGGLVQLADFIDPEPPRCSCVVIDEDGAERRVLPWSKDWRPPPGAGDLPAGGHGEWPSPPLRRAIDVLGGRVRIEGHTLSLDGGLSDARRIVAEANRVLKDRGEEPIPYPGVEPLP